jgi:TetR/AcrR family transcriptional regulator, regulator of cefoperazone and chloramphenicol sensitivity
MKRVAGKVAVESPQDTADRILAAASMEFAENGYRQTSVRDICNRAGVNVAAINYHFGDKYQLYRQTMLRITQGERPVAHHDSPGLSPKKQLRLFVEMMLRHVVGNDDKAVSARLLARELIEPSDYLDEHINQVVRPAMQRLHAIIKQLVPGIDPIRLQLAAASVVGQILLYRNAREVTRRIMPEIDALPDRHAALVDHITQFSLAGLKPLQTKTKKGKRP